MDLKLVRQDLHSIAGTLRGAAGPLGDYDPPLVTPDAGRSSGLLAALLSEISMATANYTEMVTRAADDLEACVKSYDGTEQSAAHAFDNLKPVDPKDLPRAQAPQHRAGGDK